MKKHKLRIYMLVCFLGIAAIIVAFLWMFLVALFGVYYQYTKTKTVETISKTVDAYYKNNEDYVSILDTLAYEESVCIEIVNNKETVYTSNSSSRGCLPIKSSEIRKYKETFENNNKDNQAFMVINPLFNNKTLVYASKIEENVYSYVNISIEPVSSSITILRGVLSYMTFFVIIISIIISLYLSRRISNPIIKLNEKASKLAKSEFNKIDGNINSNIAEIDELDNTIMYAKEQLSKLDETRRDLLANVSHDLKTPLTMIKAYAELTKDIDVNNSEKSKQNMEVIIEETDRLNNLVNDILELSKLQSNMNEINYEEFDITDLINTIIKRYNIYENLEKFIFEFNYGKELIINADKAKIEQVIYNLINNAMNYTGDDKKVIVLISKKKEAFRISIKDTGKGIDKEELISIWDKYYKNEKHHKRNRIGTGLGLSIVKQILVSHDFNYGVNSSKGKGSEFYFDIPFDSIIKK